MPCEKITVITRRSFLNLGLGFSLVRLVFAPLKRKFPITLLTLIRIRFGRPRGMTRSGFSSLFVIIVLRRSPIFEASPSCFLHRVREHVTCFFFRYGAMNQILQSVLAHFPCRRIAVNNGDGGKVLFGADSRARFMRNPPQAGLTSRRT